MLCKLHSCKVQHIIGNKTRAAKVVSETILSIRHSQESKQTDTFNMVLGDRGTLLTTATNGCHGKRAARKASVLQRAFSVNLEELLNEPLNV